jgi:hypothetical protein
MQTRNLKKAVLRDGIFFAASSFTGTAQLSDAYIAIGMPTGRATPPRPCLDLVRYSEGGLCGTAIYFHFPDLLPI